MARNVCLLACETAAEIAAIFDVDQGTIYAWKGQGLPCEDGKFIIADCVRWREAWWKRNRKLQSDQDKADEDGRKALKDRLTEQQIEERRLKNAKTRGELADVAEVQAMLVSAMARIAEAGRRLEIMFGPDAAEVLSEALQSANEIVSEMDIGEPVEAT